MGTGQSKTRKLSALRGSLVAIVLAAAGVLAVSVVWPRDETATSLSRLLQSTHIHGIAVDPKDPSRLYLATHNGFFALSRDGMVSRISDNQNDYMGFTPHPTDPAVFFASGHPAGGGNLGFISSNDGGQSWQRLAPGAEGPVDFHQMDVSKVDPKTIYGIYRGLQVSRDGGSSWTMVGPPPEGVIDLAASATDATTVYLGTETGLLVSRDGGKSWQAAYLLKRPVSMVRTVEGGDIYAFVVGTGLVRASERNLSWSTLGNGFGSAYVLHLAVDPTDRNRLYAATFDPANHKGDVLASADGGRTWSAYEAGR